MSKESFTNQNPMNRRDFLKTTGVAGAKVAVGASSEAQETQKLPDNFLTKTFFVASSTKIDFPDVFEAITPEVEKILTLLDVYQNSFLGGNSMNGNLSNGASQSVQHIGAAETILASKQTLWQEIRRIKPDVGEFSEQAFYQALAYTIPVYLSSFGIYAKPFLLTINKEDRATHTSTFERAEVSFTLLKIDRIERAQVERRGLRIQRNILHIQGPVEINGKKFADGGQDRPAENGFQNIMIDERKLGTQFEQFMESFQKMQTQIAAYPYGQVVENKNNFLKTTDQWTDAAEVSMTRIVEKLHERPTYEQRLDETISHETEHLADYRQLQIVQLWLAKLSSDSNQNEKINKNIRVHEEINPILAELRYSPNKALTLFEHLNTVRDRQRAESPVYGEAGKWIFKQMIAIISEDPGHYGFDIQGPISTENQILSQIDILLDKPELLDSLCDKVLTFHNQNLTEDILGEVEPLKISSPEDKTRHKVKTAAKLSVTTTLLGGAAYALKKLGERKAQVAKKETMLSRGQLKRKKNKKK